MTSFCIYNLKPSNECVRTLAMIEIDLFSLLRRTSKGILIIVLQIHDSFQVDEKWVFLFRNDRLSLVIPWFLGSNNIASRYGVLNGNDEIPLSVKPSYTPPLLHSNSPVAAQGTLKQLCYFLTEFTSPQSLLKICRKLNSKVYKLLTENEILFSVNISQRSISVNL